MSIKSISTKILYAAYFFFSWAIGFTAYSNSTVVEIINGRESVGVIYGISAAFSLVLSTWLVPKLLKNLGNRKTIGLAIILKIIAILGIKFLVSPILFGASFILFLASQVLIAFGFDIFFEHNTKKEKAVETRGIMVALQHVGRMMGPILAAFLTVSYGIRAPYDISLILIAIAGVLVYISTKDFIDKPHVSSSFINSIRTVFKRPALRKSLSSILLLQIFYALMVTFTPIYLADVVGLDPKNMGLIFTVMLTPFVILGYPIGKKIDNGASGRVMARYGLFIMAVTTLLIPFVETKSIIIWIAILLLSRVGAVILETAGDGIFFRTINEEETELLGIMRDMQPVGYFIASLIAVIVLLFGNITHIFYAVGIVLVLGIITTRKNKHYANQ